MDFLKIGHTTLEIYPKSENPSNEEDINDNSQWISIVKNILHENPDILDSDNLVLFMEKITKLFNNKTKELEKYLQNKPESESIIKEFHECFNDEYIFSRISTFINKYQIDISHSEIIIILLNIYTIKNYIQQNIKEPENMNICLFQM